MEDMKGLQQQERVRGVINKPQPQAQHQQHQQQQENPQPQQPQKCPRCESLNTKFCYYNNYSLSQPRYFCKTCRRYWTQGGTLRNVPVGGSCRKGKRAKKTSSSSDHHHQNLNNKPENENHHHHHHQPQQHQAPNLITSSTSANTYISASNSHQIPPLMAASVNPSSLYYSGGSAGFLSSLAAFQSFNQQVVPINASGGDGADQIGGGVSNLALLQGFSLPSFQLHHPQIPNMGIVKEEKPILPLEGGILIHSNRPSTSHHHQEWLPSFSSTLINPTSAEVTNYWTSNNNHNNTKTTTPSTTSLNTTYLSDLPGFGAPPPPASSSPSSLL